MRSRTRVQAPERAGGGRAVAGDTHDTYPWRDRDTLRTAAWFGAMSGFAEIGARLAALVAVAHTVRFDPNAVWMVPLTYTLVFVVLGLILVAVGRMFRRRMSLRVAVTAFAFLGLWTGFLLYPRLHPIAVAVLAAGLAVQLGRFTASRAPLFRSVVRRTGPALLAVIVLLAVSMNVRHHIVRRAAVGELAAAPSGNAPNILLLILDTVRAANLSVYGYGRATTPSLEWLAQRGVRFDSAIATAPWTLTSHVSIFTGRYPFETSADWQESLDAAHLTAAEALGRAGYVSAGFVANRLYGTPEWGLQRGFTHYEGYSQSPGQAVANGLLTRTAVSWWNRLRGTYVLPGRKDASDLNRDFLAWVDGIGSDRPFFGFINYYDAHEPYVARAPDRRFTIGEPPTRGIATGRDYSAEEIEGLRDAYDDAIAYLDHELGRLFSELDQRGLLANTLIIVTSDHGEEFGEHGYLSHGNGLYLPSLHVPLIVSFPSRVPARRTVAEPVSLRDIAATLADAAELNDELFPGRSLTRFWSAAAGAQLPPEAPTGDSPLLSEVSFVRNQPDWYPVSAGDMKAVLQDGYHYIRNGDSDEELYHLPTDPGETVDLAGEAGSNARLEALRMKVDSLTANRGEGRLQ